MQTLARRLVSSSNTGQTPPPAASARTLRPSQSKVQARGLPHHQQQRSRGGRSATWRRAGWLAGSTVLVGAATLFLRPLTAYSSNKLTYNNSDSTRRTHSSAAALANISATSSEMSYKSIRKVMPQPPRHWVGDGFHVYPVFNNMAFSEVNTHRANPTEQHLGKGVAFYRNESTKYIILLLVESCIAATLCRTGGGSSELKLRLSIVCCRSSRRGSCSTTLHPSTSRQQASSVE